MKDSQRILSWAKEEIIALKPYASAREEFVSSDREMILLDANENPFGEEVNRYPDPMQRKLKKRIAETKKVREEQIFLCNGSDEFFNQLLVCFCTAKVDQIMVLPPTFGMYQVCADINAVESIKVPLTNDFQLNIDDILKKKEKQTKIIFIPSPNNPTGNCFAKDDLRKIVEEFDGLVVIDEAYVEFASENSVVSWLDQFENLIVTQTYSKAQGMAGVRLGMAFAHPTVIGLLNKIKAPYNINVLTQNEVLKRLNEQGLVAQQVQQILQEKERLLPLLEELKYIKTIYPSDANFILIRVDDSSKRYQELIDRGIVVRNPSTNYNCQNTLRITIGTFEENNALISALRTMDS